MCGCVVVWLCGCVVVWVCGCDCARAHVVCACESFEWRMNLRYYISISVHWLQNGPAVQRAVGHERDPTSLGEGVRICSKENQVCVCVCARARARARAVDNNISGDLVHIEGILRTLDVDKVTEGYRLNI